MRSEPPAGDAPEPPNDAPRDATPRAFTSDVTPPERVMGHVMPPVATPAPEPAPPPPPPAIEIPPVVDVESLDWAAIRQAVDPDAILARGDAILESLTALLDRPDGPGFLFDADRATPEDRAIRVTELGDAPLWFIGDLHGDLLALEAALALVGGDDSARLVLLGDLFDDGGFGLALLLRVFELAAERPARVCVVAGNHDEALRWTGERLASAVSPSDFADGMATEPPDALGPRAGRLAVRFFERAPRALFLPDGLLVAHGGFPLVDLHAELEQSGDFNDRRALADFVWTRAHPKARRKLPNRASRGSQFGREDFADFCALATRLGRPVTHMVRGHDHVDERWAVYYPAQSPVLTTNALSRRLPREVFGPYTRIPTVARWVPGALPQVHRLHVPEAIVRELYPEELDSVEEGDAAPDATPEPDATEPDA